MILDLFFSIFDPFILSTECLGHSQDIADDSRGNIQGIGARTLDDQWTPRISGGVERKMIYCL